jgi:hypothetical protein
MPAPTAAPMSRGATHQSMLVDRSGVRSDDAWALRREPAGDVDVPSPLVEFGWSGYARQSCSGFRVDGARSAARAGATANAPTAHAMSNATVVRRHAPADTAGAAPRTRAAPPLRATGSATSGIQPPMKGRSRGTGDTTGG